MLMWNRTLSRRILGVRNPLERYSSTAFGNRLARFLPVSEHSVLPLLPEQ